MYLDPKMPPVPSALRMDDPDAHRELQALADLRREDREIAGPEEAEFGSVSRAREDMDYAAMEAEGAPWYDAEGVVY